VVDAGCCCLSSGDGMYELMPNALYFCHCACIASTQKQQNAPSLLPCQQATQAFKGLQLLVHAHGTTDLLFSSNGEANGANQTVLLTCRMDTQQCIAIR